jgi:hypothetical protein
MKFNIGLPTPLPDSPNSADLPRKRRNPTRFAFFLAALCAATPALAKPVTYACQLEVPRSQSWVPDQVVIRYDAETGSVVVNDPVIQHFIGAPVAGRVKADMSRRVAFAWDLVMVKNQEGQVISTLLYRATLTKPGLALRVNAIPAGNANTFAASGRCRLQ